MHGFIYQFIRFSHSIKLGGEVFIFVQWATKDVGGHLPPCSRVQYTTNKSCNSFLEKRPAIHAWYTFKYLLMWLSPWTVIFPWIHLLVGEALSYCLQSLVTLLQLPDTLLPLPYSILKGKQLPQSLQAKPSGVTLNNLVVQATPVPLGFSSSKPCSTQIFCNVLTTSAGGVMLSL